MPLTQDTLKKCENVYFKTKQIFRNNTLESFIQKEQLFLNEGTL